MDSKVDVKGAVLKSLEGQPQGETDDHRACIEAIQKKRMFLLKELAKMVS